MARQQQVLETVTCDVCGKQVDEATMVVLSWGSEKWELDLCDADNERIGKTFDEWIAGGRAVRGRRGDARRRARAVKPAAAGIVADWDYLETLGFKRHRGRKSAAEVEALENRPS